MGAQVISLSVRPLQASHLCFGTDGILGDSSIGLTGQPIASLGEPVTAFGFDKFYGALTASPSPTTGGDKSRLLYDVGQIQSYTNKYALATLRAEGRKLALQKAINARQNAFYAKYRNQAAIIDKMNSSYSSDAMYPNSKPNRLTNLSSLATQQWSQLSGAYQSTGNKRTGVYKAGVSKLGSTGKTNDLSVQVYGVTLPSSLPDPPADGDHWPKLLPGEGNTANEGTFIQEGGTSAGSATTTNEDYGYRVPYIESWAQNERAQISLIDQQFAQYMAGQSLPYLDQVFTNELSSIDMDVFRLQIAVLDTILMSPISGVVTGVYKKPGDFVRAGEPVIRVEDSSTVLLVGKLIYPGLISLKDVVTIETTLFDASQSNPLVGSVVAVRGQSEEDQWEVIVQFSNADASGQPILPLGYHFDYDDTTVSIKRPIDLSSVAPVTSFPLANPLGL